MLWSTMYYAHTWLNYVMIISLCLALFPGPNQLFIACTTVSVLQVTICIYTASDGKLDRPGNDRG